MVLLLTLSGLRTRAEAQSAAIKTNLLYDATGTINLGLEVGLASRWTLDISGNYNDWEVLDNRSWRHYLVQPEVRYWFCDRFAGHFMGLHLHGGEVDFYNLDNGIKFLGSDFSILSDHQLKGWFVGAGIGYGYAFILGEHWNLELELGIGYAYTEYDTYSWPAKQKISDDRSHNYFGITKVAVGISYLF